MSVERTFSIIKPDAVAKNMIGKITQRFEENNLQIVASKMIHLSKLSSTSKSIDISSGSSISHDMTLPVVGCFNVNFFE